MTNKSTTKLIKAIKKTGFSFAYSPEELHELGKYFENADDNLIKKAKNAIDIQEIKYQKRIKELSDKEAVSAAEELSGVIQNIKANKRKKMVKKETRTRKNEQKILSDLEKELR